MPTVLKIGPYRFYFFSREESRIHIHVSCPDGEAKFWLDPELNWPQTISFPGCNSSKLKNSSRNIMPNLEPHGIATSQTEVSNISANGIWLLCHDREYFLSFNQFPWFEDAAIKHIFNLEEPHPGHLYWPDLDIDLSLEILQNPERFPLIAST